MQNDWNAKTQALLEADLDELNEIARRRNEAIEKTAVASVRSSMLLDEISHRVETVDRGLVVERDDRKQADAALLRYTKRWDRISLAVGVVGILVGVAGLVAAFIK